MRIRLEHDERAEQLLDLAAAAELAGRQAGESGDSAAELTSCDSACPSMSRLAAIAARREPDELSVQAHRTRCRRCAARFAALIRTQSPLVEVRRMARWRRLGTVVSAAAACVLAMLSLSRGPWSYTTPAHSARRLTLTHEPSQSCAIGDSNCDGRLSETDIDAFQLALIDPEHFAAEFPSCDRMCGSDANCDGQVDGEDIEPFLHEVFGS